MSLIDNMTGRTDNIASMPTMMKDRNITAIMALISDSEKELAARPGMNTDPKTKEITKETAILDKLYAGERQYIVANL